jgi:hypothetical protein
MSQPETCGFGYNVVKDPVQPLATAFATLRAFAVKLTRVNREDAKDSPGILPNNSN